MEKFNVKINKKFALKLISFGFIFIDNSILNKFANTHTLTQMCNSTSISISLKIKKQTVNNIALNHKTAVSDVM